MTVTATHIYDIPPSVVGDRDFIAFGDDYDMALAWDTRDANANCGKIDLPAGGVINVPVLAIGIGIWGQDLALFNGFTEPQVAVVDADRDSYIAIGFESDDTPHIKLGGSATSLSMLSPLSIVSAGLPLTLQNTTDATSNEVLRLKGGNRATPADNDETYITFYLDDSSGTQVEFARITCVATDVTAASQDAKFEFAIMQGDTITNIFEMTSTAAAVVTTTMTAPIIYAESVVPAGTYCYVGRDNTGDLTINALTGKIVNIAIAGTDEYNFSATSADFNANTIDDVGTISVTNAAGPSVLNEAATTTNPTLVPNRAEVDTGIGWASDTIHIVLGGADEFSFTTATFDMNGNTITDAGTINAENAAGPSIANEAATTTNPTLIPDRAEMDTGIGWASDVIHIVLGGVSEYNFSTTILDMNGNALDNCGFIILNAATAPANTEVYLVNDNTGDLTLHAVSGKVVNLAIAGTDVLRIQGTSVYFLQDLYTDRWLPGTNGNTFVGIGVVGAGNLVHYGGGTKGWYNSAFGYQALYSCTEGDFNSAFGHRALYSNTTGGANNAFGEGSLELNTTGSGNAGFGDYTIHNNLTGIRNCGFGYAALSQTLGTGNVAVGWGAGNAITTGTYNTIIGYSANVSAAADDNSIVIGNSVTGAGSNTITIGDNTNQGRLLGDNAGDMTINALSGKSVHIAVAGTDEYDFSATALAMNGNNITGLGTLALTGAITISPTAAGTFLDFVLETEWTAGTLIRADFASSTTATEAIVGMILDYSNLTPLTTKAVTGYELKMPAFTQTAATTTNLIGFYLSTAGAMEQTTNAGTINWFGASIQMPNITETTGTIVSIGLNILGGTVSATAQQYGIRLGDDVIFALGTGFDQVMLNKSAGLATNTALADVLIGTPVAEAIAANSLMISNVTSGGDIALYINKGGHSQMAFWAGGGGDTSILAASGNSVDHYIAGTKVLDHSSGAFAFQESTTISSTGTLTINAFTLGGKLTGGANEIEGSVFDIDGGDISAVTISGGLTWSAAQNFGAYLHCINDTANTFMTVGLTINQGAADNEILAFKSSDVGHPFTALAEADTFGTLSKAQATSGGLSVIGFTDADGVAGLAVLLVGYLGEAADTTKTTAAIGVVQITARITDGGTSHTLVGADGNLAVITNGPTACFIFDADGEFHCTDVVCGLGEGGVTALTGGEVRAPNLISGAGVDDVAGCNLAISPGLGRGSGTLGIVTINGAVVAAADTVQTLTPVLRVQGALMGFFGHAVAAQPSAYTQTYATADKTHAARTAEAITDNSGGAASQTLASITGGGAGCEDATKNAIASLADDLNKLRADQLDTAQVVNALIDDLQAIGLAQ